MITIAMLFIVLFTCFLAAIIKNKKAKIIPLAVATILIFTVIGVYHYNVKNRIRFDRYEINNSTRMINQGNRQLASDHKKMTETRNQLAVLPKLIHYGSKKRQKKARKLYKSKALKYKRRIKHYQKLTKISRRSRQEARNSLAYSKKDYQNN